jgi:hypothetical protein
MPIPAIRQRSKVINLSGTLGTKTIKNPEPVHKISQKRESYLPLEIKKAGN